MAQEMIPLPHEALASTEVSDVVTRERALFGALSDVINAFGIAKNGELSVSVPVDVASSPIVLGRGEQKPEVSFDGIRLNADSTEWVVTIVCKNDTEEVSFRAGKDRPTRSTWNYTDDSHNSFAADHAELQRLTDFFAGKYPEQLAARGLQVGRQKRAAAGLGKAFRRAFRRG